MNTGRVTTSGLLPRQRWTKVAGYAVVALVAAYGCWVLALELPGLAYLLVAAAVVLLDGLLLFLGARRRSPGVAIRCGAVAVLAALVQAIWVYIPFRWDVLATNGEGVVWFASPLALALMLTAGLLLRRQSRPYGWAVLMGSFQGFVASSLVVLAAFAVTIAD
jgi:hypothetical protein